MVYKCPSFCLYLLQLTAQFLCDEMHKGLQYLQKKKWWWWGKKSPTLILKKKMTKERQKL